MTAGRFVIRAPTLATHGEYMAWIACFVDTQLALRMDAELETLRAEGLSDDEVADAEKWLCEPYAATRREMLAELSRIGCDPWAPTHKLQ